MKGRRLGFPETEAENPLDGLEPRGFGFEWGRGPRGGMGGAGRMVETRSAARGRELFVTVRRGDAKGVRMVLRARGVEGSSSTWRTSMGVSL